MNLFPVAFNYIPSVNLETLVVKRKGKVIKGETEALQAKALQERNAMRNAAKRVRRARGYTLAELLFVIVVLAIMVAFFIVLGHFIAKFW